MSELRQSGTSNLHLLLNLSVVFLANASYRENVFPKMYTQNTPETTPVDQIKNLLANQHKYHYRDSFY